MENYWVLIKWVDFYTHTHTHTHIYIYMAQIIDSSFFVEILCTFWVITRQLY